MSHLVRFKHNGEVGFGTLNGDFINLCRGNMYGEWWPSEEQRGLAEVELLTPCAPSKMVALWNNFHERAAKEGLNPPQHPLYFLKTTNCFLADRQLIVRPADYDGPVVYEGELGIVIGRPCNQVSVNQADQHILGYTCVNDVTARAILREDPAFLQWTRSKSFETFGPFGPCIATCLAPDRLIVKTLVNGEEVQNYPVSDMFFRPRELVSRISHDFPLYPGDVIACGTSVGAGPLPEGSTVEVTIDGIGSLVNHFG